jgi:hypothetical protein
MLGYLHETPKSNLFDEKHRDYQNELVFREIDGRLLAFAKIFGRPPVLLLELIIKGFTALITTFSYSGPNNNISANVCPAIDGGAFARGVHTTLRSTKAPKCLDSLSRTQPLFSIYLRCHASRRISEWRPWIVPEPGFNFGKPQLYRCMRARAALMVSAT